MEQSSNEAIRKLAKKFNKLPRAEPANELAAEQTAFLVGSKNWLAKSTFWGNRSAANLLPQK